MTLLLLLGICFVNGLTEILALPVYQVTVVKQGVFPYVLSLRNPP